jgi:hypothetical protein
MTRTRRKPTWEQHFPTRLRFEREALAAYPHLSKGGVGSRRYSRTVYGLVVPIPDYESREIELQFFRTTSQPEVARIYADGPTSSPHRYAPHPKDTRRRSSLCIWYPEDPPALRWIPKDGLLSLIEMTRIHLFKEAYWRETGEWLGDEAPHPTPDSKPC